MSLPRLHLPALPHTQTVTEEMTVCAFTSKAWRFGEMMSKLGYEIIVYSGEHNDMVCHEHVPTFTDAQQRRWYGDHDPNLLPTVANWDANADCWQEMNAAVIREMGKRVEPADLILLLAGTAQLQIARAFPENVSAEWAVGYEGCFAWRRCFESYAWMHYIWGRDKAEARWYDVVIPNFFRPQDFKVAASRDDYLLYVGRITRRKGLEVAVELAKATQRKLLVAGSGVNEHRPGLIVADGGDLRLEYADMHYLGPVGVELRNELMRNAHAILVPTIYVEPFGAVAVEAQLAGCPAITTPWGAMSETVVEGETGFHMHTLAEGVAAVEAAGALDGKAIRKKALTRYSLDAVGPQYDRWLKQLAGLYDGGWMA